ncbi:MAG: diguanylate cyclase [Campylobacterota bacterium]
MKHTILVVDDSGTNIDLLIGLLGKKYDLVVATNGFDALEIARQEAIDLILLDIMMPKIDGYGVCKELKNEETTKDIPVIFVTAKTDEESIEKAYDIGGVDYVTKPFKAKELQSRVKTQLKLQETLQKLEFLASMDSMTGSYNRRKFFEIAKKKMATMDENCYAVMIDLDHFKLVNDNYGHHIGDEILKKAVSCVQKNLDPGEIIGRLGGEEFALLLRADSQKNASLRLEKMREDIQNLFIITDEHDKVAITASFGVTKYLHRFDNIDKLLSQADDALYEAKKNGRNRVYFSKN